MLSLILLLILGFTALYFGAEWLVKGSVSVARLTGIRPVIIALTIVAFGTSAPEFIVSVNASIQHSSNIAVGNIVGSMIANIALILGISALIKPLEIEFRLLKKEVPILLICEIVFLIFALNLEISRPEGALLFLFFILFNWYCIREAGKNIQMQSSKLKKEYEEYMLRKRNGKLYNSILIVVGLILLIIGAHLAVKGAVGIAAIYKISPFVIAASIIAFGTSLPELATSAIAAARGESDISVGNILGSNIFNILMCIGLAAIINPITVENTVLRYDIIYMIFVSLILGLFMWTKRKIGRFEGFLLILLYIIYLIYLFN